MMNLFAIASLSAGVSCVGLSLTALFFGKTKLHRLLLNFNLVVATWGLGLFLVGIADSRVAAINAWKIAHLGGFFVAPAFYHMVSHFCGLSRKKLIYLCYLQALFFNLLSIGTGHVFNEVRYVYGLYYNVMTPLYLPALLLYFFFIILSYHELFRFLKRTRGQKRLQTQYIIFGFIIGFIGATSTFLPMFKINLFYPSGNFGITVYALILSYSIFRYRLMDIHLIFRRTMAYSISAGLLTGLYILLIIIMTRYISNLAGHDSLGIYITAALIIAMLFNPLHNRIRLFVDKVFYKSKYDYFSTVQEAGAELVKIINTGEIQLYILNVIFKTLKLKSAYLLSAEGEYFKGEYSGLTKDTPSDKDRVRRIANDSELVRLLKNRKGIIVKEELTAVVGQDKIENIAEDLKRFDTEIAVPIFIEDELACILLLGEKQSGDIYSDEDIKLLSTISNQAAISLKNAKLYGELEQKVKERTAELESAKDEIEAWNKKLEIRVREKTEELVRSKEQLIHSEKLSAMGQMAGGLAHELNSPLAGLLPMIEKYRDKENKDSEAYNELSLMLKACKFMAKIIRDFGSFSRKSKGNFYDLNLNEVIEDTLSFSSGRLKQSGIKIIKEYENKLPVIQGDKTGLQQVVLNIVTNSCDAMPDGGMLTIKTFFSEDEDSVLMKFIDTGTGIKDDVLDKIFNPFFTTKGPGKGTGLGLSVSYGIINEHRGMICAESGSHGGTEFSISLPVGKA